MGELRTGGGYPTPFTTFHTPIINLNINHTGKPGGDLNLNKNLVLDCFLTQKEAKQEVKKYDDVFPLTGVPTIENAFNKSSQCQAQ